MGTSVAGTPNNDRRSESAANGDTAPPPIGTTCDTCGEDTAGHGAAEVVRDGRHVIVHADTCLRAGEEVA